MTTELIINASLPEVRIALMEDGRIQELLVERPSDKGIVGNIYKGRVTRVLPGMQAAFVDIGLEKAAFLYVDDVFVHPEVFGEEKGTKTQDDPQDYEGSDSGDESISDEEMSAADSDFDIDDEDDDDSVIDDSEDDQLEAVYTAAYLEEDSGELESEQTSLDADADESSDSDSEPEEPAEDVSEEEGEASSDQVNEEEDDDRTPVEMGAPPEDEEAAPEGTIEEEAAGGSADESSEVSNEEASSSEGELAADPSSDQEVEQSAESAESTGSDSEVESVESQDGESSRGRGRSGRGRGRGRRDSRGRGRNDREERNQGPVPDHYMETLEDQGSLLTDRAVMSSEQTATGLTPRDVEKRGRKLDSRGNYARRTEFRDRRGKDRRIRGRKTTGRPQRQRFAIDELLVEGQEVMVQVAKDPIAAKGARLTCHVSLAGRHLVCMPTINHIGVSRRIERDDERRKLRYMVEKHRPARQGYIVRTASSGVEAEVAIKQDIDYLSRTWDEICEKARSVAAPALVYEDLNSVVRAVRDWVSEDLKKIMVDSRFYYNEIRDFVSRFMPDIAESVELYHGDVPIFDAFGISTELHRALERKVWLKSGGYLVIDQAEALVAIDINTGRFVGKKNLEDTILKTNLEAVEEIAFQLRLRNCGGIIIIDLIDMEKEENRQRVLRTLESALTKDRARPTVVGMSDLGLIEMTRKRTRDTLVRALCQPCNHCEAKGFVKSQVTVAYEVLREVERAGIDREIKKVLIQAHPDVVDLLAIDERESLELLEKRYRKQIYLQAVYDFHLEQFEVVGDKSDRKHNNQRRNSTRTHARRNTNGGRQRNDRGRGRGRGRGRDDQRRPRREAAESREGQLPAEENPASNAESDQEQNFNATPGNAVPNGEFAEKDGNRVAAPKAPGGGGEDSADEEDRLAYLRAQAAQDAAIAMYGAQESSSPSQSFRGGQGKGRSNKKSPSGSSGGSTRTRRGRGGSGGRSNQRRSSGGRGRSGSSRSLTTRSSSESGGGETGGQSNPGA